MVATAQPDKLWDPIAARWARTHGAAILSEFEPRGRGVVGSFASHFEFNRARRLPTHHKSDDV